jgi:hypothetical protein
MCFNLIYGWEKFLLTHSIPLARWAVLAPFAHLPTFK